jgi:hypothetical protein
MTTRDIALRMLANRAMDTNGLMLMRLMWSPVRCGFAGTKDKGVS